MAETYKEIHNIEGESSAFRTIGEVSSSLNLPPHVLRFWESKFLNIKPHKRRGGHRYYSEDDINVIKEIKSLLYEKGYTIKGAQKFLRNQKTEKPVEKDQPSLFMEQGDGVEKAPVQANSGDIEVKAVKLFIKKLEDVKNHLIEIKNLD